MSNHISEDLPLLLTGDARRDVVLAAAAHLRTCPDCQQELVSAVVAHASLTAAHRFAPEIVTRDLTDGVPGTSRDVHDDEPDADGQHHDPVEPPLPDMSAMFATVRDEAAQAAAAPARRRRRLLAVAAAVVVLGAGGVTLAETVGSSSTPAGRTVALAAYGVGTTSAQAHIVDGASVAIDASKLPKLSGDRDYEVWLTNAARNSMQSIGFIGGDNTVSLPVKRDWLRKYSDIEISVQQPDQTKYSGISVLRGTYS